LIKNILFWIITRRPVVYGALYLCVIPTYALIYSYSIGMDLEYTKTSDTLLTNLYYSVVTITTLGYGDILPKNVETQLVVATEVLFGVLLIGLFLNSIAQHISQKISSEEKLAQKEAKVCSEALKLQNVNKIVEMNIQYYLTYVIPVTTPIAKRNDQDEINENFTLNDMQDLYGPSLRLRDNNFQPAVLYYFQHQASLVKSIKELVYHVDLRPWPSLEDVCLRIINRSMELDYSEFIKGQPNIKVGDKKGSDLDVEMLKNHTGEVKFLQSNSINAYVGLYWLIKGNLSDIKEYRAQVSTIITNFLPSGSDN
jgi:hypothetical protein